MKKHKIKNNILFIFLVTILIGLVCILNYKMDPYSLFKNKHYMILSNYPIELIYPVMKIYKDQKSDTVIIGGSETTSLFDEQFKNFFNNISIEGINFSQYSELLDAYIKLHPETKKVIIVISYVNIINDIGITIPKFNETNITLKEYQRILFSNDVTYRSLLSVKDHFIYKYFNNKLNIENEKFFIEFKPKQADKYEADLYELKELEKKNFNNVNSIIKMLDKKNIDYIFIIPPYNATFLSIMYNQEHFQYYIDNFRRFLVSIVPNDKKIYDFAFVNKYTSSNMYENKDALYINLSHPTIIFGIKIFKILYNHKNADHSLYFILNKENVESIIKKENKLLKNYIKNNTKIIEYYTELRDSQREEDILYLKRIYEDSMSNDSKEEYKYLINNISKYN